MRNSKPPDAPVQRKHRNIWPYLSTFADVSINITPAVIENVGEMRNDDAMRRRGEFMGTMMDIHNEHKELSEKIARQNQFESQNPVLYQSPPDPPDH